MHFGKLVTAALAALKGSQGFPTGTGLQPGGVIPPTEMSTVPSIPPARGVDDYMTAKTPGVMISPQSWELPPKGLNIKDQEWLKQVLREPPKAMALKEIINSIMKMGGTKERMDALMQHLKRMLEAEYELQKPPVDEVIGYADLGREQLQEEGHGKIYGKVMHKNNDMMGDESST